MARGLTANRSPIHGRRGPGNPSDGGSFPTTPSVPAAPTFSGTLRVVDGVTYLTISAAIAASTAGDRIRLDIRRNEDRRLVPIDPLTCAPLPAIDAK